MGARSALWLPKRGAGEARRPPCRHRRPRTRTIAHARCPCTRTRTQPSWATTATKPNNSLEHADGERRGISADLKAPKDASHRRPFRRHPPDSIWPPSAFAVGVRRRDVKKKVLGRGRGGLRLQPDLAPLRQGARSPAGYEPRRNRQQINAQLRCVFFTTFRSTPTANAEVLCRSEGTQRCVLPRPCRRYPPIRPGPSVFALGTP